MNKKISLEKAQAFMDEVKALPEGSLLTIDNGELTAIMDERTGVPSKVFDIMDEVREMSQRPVIAALRDLHAAILAFVELKDYPPRFADAVNSVAKQLEEGFGIAEPL